MIFHSGAPGQRIESFAKRWRPPWSILSRKKILIFWGIFQIWGQILRFLVKITWFFSFSNKNDAESSRNFIKKWVLDPRRTKLVQMSLRKVDGKLTPSPRLVQEGPYGPIWAHIWAHQGPYGSIYGPILAPTRTGPEPGQGPNPDWAPTRPGPGKELSSWASKKHEVVEIGKTNQEQKELVSWTGLDRPGQASVWTSGRRISKCSGLNKGDNRQDYWVSNWFIN